VGIGGELGGDFGGAIDDVDHEIAVNGAEELTVAEFTNFEAKEVIAILIRNNLEVTCNWVEILVGRLTKRMRIMIIWSKKWDGVKRRRNIRIWYWRHINRIICTRPIKWVVKFIY